MRVPIEPCFRRQSFKLSDKLGKGLIPLLEVIVLYPSSFLAIGVIVPYIYKTLKLSRLYLPEGNLVLVRLYVHAGLIGEEGCDIRDFVTRV